jgi:hypothetical protein
MIHIKYNAFCVVSAKDHLENLGKLGLLLTLAQNANYLIFMFWSIACWDGSKPGLSFDRRILNTLAILISRKGDHRELGHSFTP